MSVALDRYIPRIETLKEIRDFTFHLRALEGSDNLIADELRYDMLRSERERMRFSRLVSDLSLGLYTMRHTPGQTVFRNWCYVLVTAGWNLRWEYRDIDPSVRARLHEVHTATHDWIQDIPAEVIGPICTELDELVTSNPEELVGRLTMFRLKI